MAGCDPQIKDRRNNTTLATTKDEKKSHEDKTKDHFSTLLCATLPVQTRTIR